MMTIKRIDDVLNAGLPDSAPLGNLSVVENGDHMFGYVRLFNYKILFVHYFRTRPRPEALFADFDKDFNIIKVYRTRVKYPPELKDDIDPPYGPNGDLNTRHTPVLRRMEDIRLFRKNGALMFCSTFISTHKKSMEHIAFFMVGTIEISEDDVIMNILYCSSSDESIQIHDWEKNWMPFLDDGPGLNFVYKAEKDSHTILHMDFDGSSIKPNSTLRTISHPSIEHDYRGGSPVVRFKDRYICLVHRVEPVKRYTHRFLQFDENFNLVGASQEFKISQQPIEFSTCILPRGDGMRILLTVNDIENYVVDCDMAMR